ncbi:ATP-binding protein, partial [Ilumatobacter sp.]|uniref:ATP-binding protein n=1 Tax=Ilumatobacter sp. TaxID=1967498 RepID=UPI003C66473D
DHLLSRRSLVVIDNCEHVLATAASLVDEVVRGCPTVVIVATSREHLGIDGERVHPVSGLDDLDAHTLFCDRAAAADDRFAPDDDDRRAIDRICERLDGNPLAIELAAARTRSLTPVDLLHRLDDRFAVLRSGRIGSERHQTLAAAVEWSYELLDEVERAVFACLSIFPGDFDHAAAIAVGGAEPRLVDAVLDSLVSKSLVVSDRSGRHSRYRLLETLREFGKARLHEQGEAEEVRRRHQLHFHTVAAEVRALTDPSVVTDMTPFAMVRRDWHNFRVAVASALDDGMPELAAGIALLPPVYYLFLDEHAEWMISIVDQLPDDHRLACISHAFATLWCTLRGENEAAFSRGLRGLDLDDLTGGVGHCMLWWAVGEAHLNTGKPVEALAAARRSLMVGAVNREQPDTEVVNPLELCCLAGLAVEPEAVQGYADRLAAVAAAVPSEVNVAIAANGECFGLLARGATDAAIERFRATCAVTRGLPHMQGEAMKNLAVAASWADSPAAEEIFTEAFDVVARGRMWSFAWVVIEALAIHWYRRGRIADAAVLLGYLERHGLAFGVLVKSRADVDQVVGHTNRVADQRDQGAAMTRDKLVAFTRERLGAPPIASTTPEPRSLGASEPAYEESNRGTSDQPQRSDPVR